VEEAGSLRSRHPPGLFGIPEDKDSEATAHGTIAASSKSCHCWKQAVPIVIADTCVCEYTSHGHCGYLELNDLTGRVLNDPTLELLKRTAVSQANAGVDIIVRG